MFVVALLSLTGCSRAKPSSLQRFDALRPSLRSVTALSARVGADVAQINSGMRRDNIGSIERADGHLGRDAGHLAWLTRMMRARISSLRKTDRKGVVGDYFDLTLSALAQQASEARWAGLLARTVRQDPLLLSPRSYWAALAQSRRAAGYARASVVFTAMARVLKDHYRDKFRYVKVINRD